MRRATDVSVEFHEMLLFLELDAKQEGSLSSMLADLSIRYRLALALVLVASRGMLGASFVDSITGHSAELSLAQSLLSVLGMWLCSSVVDNMRWGRR